MWDIGRGGRLPPEVMPPPRGWCQERPKGQEYCELVNQASKANNEQVTSNGATSK